MKHYLIDKIRERVENGKPQEFFLENPNHAELIDEEINAMSNVELLEIIGYILEGE